MVISTYWYGYYHNMLNDVVITVTNTTTATATNYQSQNLITNYQNFYLYNNYYKGQTNTVDILNIKYDTKVLLNCFINHFQFPIFVVLKLCKYN